MVVAGFYICPAPEGAPVLPYDHESGYCLQGHGKLGEIPPTTPTWMVRVKATQEVHDQMQSDPRFLFLEYADDDEQA